jgi:hypothetical protein
LRELARLPTRARVLEVGSGSEGLGTWWQQPFVGVDIHFDYQRVANLRPVVADATRLPFPNDTFDLVVCVAVLLHLEGAATVRHVCEEMVRVGADTIVVVTPCGRAAHESDVRNLAWLREHGLEVRPWIVDQVERGVLEEEEMTALLAPHGALTVGTTVSVPWQDRLFRIEHRLLQAPGVMTALQPALRGWGRVRAKELAGGGPPYEKFFVLRTQATSSPPRAAS